MGQDLGFAWMEAFERGETWRQTLAEGALLLDPAARGALENGIRQAAELERIKNWKALVPWRSDHFPE